MGEGLATARRDAGADMAITSPEFHQVNGEDACVRWSRAFFISSMRESLIGRRIGFGTPCDFAGVAPLQKYSLISAARSSGRSATIVSPSIKGINHESILT